MFFFSVLLRWFIISSGIRERERERLESTTLRFVPTRHLMQVCLRVRFLLGEIQLCFLLVVLLSHYSNSLLFLVLADYDIMLGNWAHHQPLNIIGPQEKPNMRFWAVWQLLHG